MLTNKVLCIKSFSATYFMFSLELDHNVLFSDYFKHLRQNILFTSNHLQDNLQSIQQTVNLVIIFS